MAKKIDLSGIKRIAQRVAETPKKAEQAVQRARVTLRRRIVPEARRDIQAEYNLKASRITAGLTARNTPEGVELVGSKRGIGLIEFGGRATKAGATAKVRKDGGASIRPSAFVAPLLGNNPHIVERYGKKRRMTAGRYVGKMRQPLSVEYGPSIAQMLRRPGRAEHLGDYAQNILTSEILRLLG